VAFDIFRCNNLLAVQDKAHLFTTDATASSRQQTEIQNRDAVLKSIRFQGYHSNKECTPFFQQGIETLKIYFVKTIN